MILTSDLLVLHFMWATLQQLMFIRYVTFNVWCSWSMILTDEMALWVTLAMINMHTKLNFLFYFILELQAVT